MRRARPLLGTFVEIEAQGTADAIAAGALEQAVSAAFAAVALVHRLMSFHEPDSDLSRLNRSAATEPVAVHPWTAAVLRRARRLFHATAGLFDCAVGHDLARLGLLPAHDFGPGEAGDFSAVEFLPGNRFAFAARIALDLGGIAKGFAVDRAIAVLRAHGVREALVNAGGDLAAFGPATETVHIRHPLDPRRLMCGIEIDAQALASSGNRFDPFRSANLSGPAVIDPRTRQAVRRFAAATVRAPSCLIADALTKVVIAEGPAAADLLDHYRAGALVISAAGDVEMTENLQGAVRLAA